MASSHHFTHSRQVSARSAPPLRCCAVPLLRLFEHTLAAVGAIPEYQFGRKYSVYSNILWPSKCPLFSTRQTCIVLKSGWSSTARMPRLVVSPPSFSPSQPPTPPPNRWPALTNLRPLAKFQLVWRRLCEALLSSSLAGQKHQSLLPRLCQIYRRFKGRFALNMNIKSSIIFADTVHALTATFAVWTRPSPKVRSSATNHG